MTRLCRCGHTAHAHQHYRAGSDCSLCDCPRWCRPYFAWVRLRSL
jgi:hypothetical protein